MSEPKIGKKTFSELWLLACKLWMIVAVGATVMIITTWTLILIQNIDEFHDTIENGYVNNTNIPKHLGGAVFAAAFDVAMINFALISLCADIFWKFPICKQIVEMFYTDGLLNDQKMNEIEYFFLIANAFLKLFIVVTTGAQTYVGLEPDNDDVDTPLFCLYTVFIFLGTIPFTIIASMFIIQDNRKKAWLASGKK